MVRRSLIEVGRPRAFRVLVRVGLTAVDLDVPTHRRKEVYKWTGQFYLWTERVYTLNHAWTPE